LGRGLEKKEEVVGEAEMKKKNSSIKLSDAMKVAKKSYKK
jgi:hypothetical protein